jgi:hypothetical protein
MAVKIFLVNTAVLPSADVDPVLRSENCSCAQERAITPTGLGRVRVGGHGRGRRVTNEELTFGRLFVSVEEVKPSAAGLHLAMRAGQFFDRKVGFGHRLARVAIDFSDSLVVDLGVGEPVIAVGANQQPSGHWTPIPAGAILDVAN